MRRTAPTLAILAALGALALSGCVPANAYNERDAFGFGNSSYGYPSYGNTSYGYPSYGNMSFGNPYFGYPTYGLRRDRDRDHDHDHDRDHDRGDYRDHDRDDDRDRRRGNRDHDSHADRDEFDRDRFRGDRRRDFQSGAILRGGERFVGQVPPWQVQVRPQPDSTHAPHPSVQDPSHSHWWGPK